MNRSGFTLVELLVVIGIISILLSIGTFQFSQYSRKSETEGQTKKLYGDLLEMRSHALFEKQSKTAKLTATSVSFYASIDTTVPPIETKTLHRPITWTNSANIVFDSRGMLPYAASDNQTICVTEENDASVDSIVISMTQVQLGKRNKGTVCDHDNIVFK